MSHMAAIHPACKVKKGQVVPFHTMKAYRGNRGIDPLILNLALGGGECLALCFGHFTPPGRNPSTHWIEGWMVPRAVPDTSENRKSLSLTGIQTMNCSACSLVTVPATVLQLTSIHYGLWYVTSHILLVLFSEITRSQNCWVFCRQHHDIRVLHKLQKFWNCWFAWLYTSLPQ
jgi:hypothetical protein